MKIRIFSILAFAVLLFCSFTSPGDVVDLSKFGTANCYIVSKTGRYKFRVSKGNSKASVGPVSNVAVLWESFGTDVEPSVGALIERVAFKDGYIAFQTADEFKEGNAVIAAKNASGKILWSWHIWLTDQPKEQVYYNNAGTMMDRNLGATSATPGDVGALGFLYQWGRKDPFLGSSSISGNVEAKSTIAWPSTVSSNSSNGTIEYATAQPTTFITGNDKNYDWYYTGSSSTDNTRWTNSAKPKSIYDPCPAGWRVPDGGYNGVWSKALGSSSGFNYTYDSANEGMNFSGKFGNASTIWYPASGYRYRKDGFLNNLGSRGRFWSASYYLYFLDNGNVDPSGSLGRAYGLSVRCVKEDSLSPAPHQHTYQSDLNISSATDLSSSGSANCYIVSKSGTYKFKTVKGNSSTPVGSVYFAETLWETFGTSTTPSIGDLVSAITYKDGYVAFQTADTFKEGNAVIAAKDVNGKILWSWHIWLTDQPKEQVYYNNAGTMMDRNLGATSATPGDVGALGLLYQWGRKDPFLGSSSISSSTLAKSTIAWPSPVPSNSSNGTIEYATAHPTTFITDNDKNNDWYYTGDSSTDNTRWTNSAKPKSIYDPCPAGWRVPGGENYGVWSKALGGTSDFYHTYSSTNEGMNFSGRFGSDQTIWYPASGCRNRSVGSLYGVGRIGEYWSASPYHYNACTLGLSDIGGVCPSYSGRRAFGRSVRCLQE